jgi:hypothetical protein
LNNKSAARIANTKKMNLIKSFINVPPFLFSP